MGVCFGGVSSGQCPFLSLALKQYLRERHFGVGELSTELSSETAEGRVTQGREGCQDMKPLPVYLSLVVNGDERHTFRFSAGRGGVSLNAARCSR
jgi:hypothetical protein